MPADVSSLSVQHRNKNATTLSEQVAATPGRCIDEIGKLGVNCGSVLFSCTERLGKPANMGSGMMMKPFACDAT